MYFRGQAIPNAAPDYIHKAAQVIDYTNLLEEERIMIDRMQRAQDRYDSEIYTAWHDGEIKGHADGLKEGEAKVARNLLLKGMTPASIAEVTSLTEAEIKSLMQ